MKMPKGMFGESVRPKRTKENQKKVGELVSEYGRNAKHQRSLPPGVINNRAFMRNRVQIPQELGELGYRRKPGVTDYVRSAGKTIREAAKKKISGKQ